MANNIGWGQGAINNAIGWGQGVVNNLIGWGSIYLLTWSGETDILGSSFSVLVTNFKSRVSTDLGTFEAENCLNSFIYSLNNIFSTSDFIYTFKNRVSTDLGTYEAENCQVTIINNLNNI